MERDWVGLNLGAGSSSVFGFKIAIEIGWDA